MYWYQQQQNRLLVMEKDIVKAIEIAAPTNNEGNEDNISLLILLMRRKDSKMNMQIENQLQSDIGTTTITTTTSSSSTTTSTTTTKVKVGLCSA